MKRRGFPTIDAYLGLKFNQLINEVGGKGAGLELLHKLQGNYNKRQEYGVCGEDWGYVGYFSIGTSLYAEAERVLKKVLKKPLQFYHKHTENKFNHPKTNDEAAWQISSDQLVPYLMADKRFAKEISITLMKCGKRFRTWPKNYHYHVRSSSTIEDWRDDRYFGTFSTLQRVNSFFKGEKDKHIPLRYHLISLIKRFYWMKHHAKDQYKLHENEKLGIVVTPSVTKYMMRNLIVFSSYPEDEDSGVVIEVQDKERSYLGALQLLCVKGNDIEIQEAQSYNYMEQNDEDLCKENLHRKRTETERYCEKFIYDVQGQRSLLSEKDIKQIARFAKFCEEKIGYPVNLELVYTKSEGNLRRIYPVQIRPAPVLNPKRKVKILEPLPEDKYLIAETPFVIGSYRKTGPLVLAENKNGHFHYQFNEDVIMWETEGDKGHRFYFADKHCIGILNPDKASALTHDVSIVPPFGKDRDEFVFMGVPGLEDKLLECLENVQVLGKEGYICRYGWSQFPFTMESDGRKGRLYIDRKNLKKFQHERLGELFHGDSSSHIPRIKARYNPDKHQRPF